MSNAIRHYLSYILKQQWCLSVCGDKQGGVGVGQGGQGRHPPTGLAGGPQQLFGWSSYSANVFFLLSSPTYVSSPSLAREGEKHFIFIIQNNNKNRKHIK
jgi:hypothetical protein